MPEETIAVEDVPPARAGSKQSKGNGMLMGNQRIVDDGEAPQANLRRANAEHDDDGVDPLAVASNHRDSAHLHLASTPTFDPETSQNDGVCTSETFGEQTSHGHLSRFASRGRPAFSASSPQPPHSPLSLIHNRSFPGASSVVGLGTSHFIDGEGVADLASILTTDKSQHFAEGLTAAIRSGVFPAERPSATCASSPSPSGAAPFGFGTSYTDAVRIEAEAGTARPTPLGGQSFCTSAVDQLWADECQIPQPFGEYLGTALDLVPAYSNGAVEDISHGVSLLPGTQIYCGMPWECLEYARRFLIAWYGITFASMDGANSLFNCDYFLYLENFEKEVEKGCHNEEVWTAPPVVVKREVNGEAMSVPSVGSLLLYPIVYPAADMPFGHVSVVVERCHNKIRVAEQNWDNTKWAHKRYSRELEVSVDTATGKVTVLDEYPYTVLGWLDFSENERRAPLSWDKSYANDNTRLGPSVPFAQSNEEELNTNDGGDDDGRNEKRSEDCACSGVNSDTHQET